MNIYAKITLIIMPLLLLGCSAGTTIEKLTIERTDHPVAYTGLRSSNYGITPFPSEENWGYAFEKMKSYFPESESCGIWIIGTINEESACSLEFPKPNNSQNYSNITFLGYDKHESYLDYFDNNGIKVMLQVEPGQGDIMTLIEIIMNQYGHHKSVIGFGVDLEWYAPQGQEGMNGDTYFVSLDNETAMTWDAKVKSYNSSYRLFLKHWICDESIMPQNTTSDIIFINDAQNFPDLEGMTDHFSNWSDNFRKNNNIRAVGYQIGYSSDRHYWNGFLAEPHPQNLSNAILKVIPDDQEVSFFWVDFTMQEVLLP